jgi:hypothetical protein
MNRWRVGEDRGSKETDGCPLTIPHPMTLLIAFPLQVIIPYLILYHLFLLTYCRITYLLSSSYIPSPHVCPTRRLNPFS